MALAAIHRRALLSFDIESLARMARSADGASPGVEQDVAVQRVAALWHDLMRGGEHIAGLDERAREVFAEVQRDKRADLVIEITALRALGALGAGRLDEATDLARKASRMGRTEALSEEELLANIVLARVRRHGGEPHLAARILAALARHAPPAWRGWIGLELLLAAGPDAPAWPLPTPRPSPADRALTAAHALAGLLAAARAGDRACFGAHAAALSAALAGFAPLRVESQMVVQLLDADRELDPALEPWCRGETEALPLGLHGLSPHGADETAAENIVAHVVAHPGGRGRRVLSLGLPLGTRGEHLVPLTSEGQGAQGRTLGAIAALALAGPAGMGRDEFWTRVYGFAYAPSIHRNVLNVMIHRARKRLEPVGAIARDDEHLALTLHSPLAVQDPRCTESTLGRVLRLLARKGVGRVEELADELQVSARTVQMALQKLVADGACQIEREGREIRYRVDDTTFTEPTDWGGSPPST